MRSAVYTVQQKYAQFMSTILLIIIISLFFASISFIYYNSAFAALQTTFSLTEVDHESFENARLALNLHAANQCQSEAAQMGEYERIILSRKGPYQSQQRSYTGKGACHDLYGSGWVCDEVTIHDYSVSAEYFCSAE